MLTITAEALAVIQQVTDHPALEPGSGLRIARPRATSSPLQVRAANQPQPGDEVVLRPGARLFLDPEAQRTTAGQRLDVVKDELGRHQFILRDAA